MCQAPDCSDEHDCGEFVKKTGFSFLSVKKLSEAYKERLTNESFTFKIHQFITFFEASQLEKVHFVFFPVKATVEKLSRVTSRTQECVDGLTCP